MMSWRGRRLKKEKKNRFLRDVKRQLVRKAILGAPMRQSLISLDSRL